MIFISLTQHAVPASVTVRVDSILVIAGIPELDRARQPTGEHDGSTLLLAGSETSVAVAEPPERVMELMREAWVAARGEEKP